jgi:DNA-binding MarR family transcriptional regulator
MVSRDKSGFNGNVDPDRFFGFTVVRLAHVLQRRIEQALKSEVGIGVRQFGALAYIAGEPGIGSAALARKLLITAQSAGPLIDGLVALGLVERERDARPGTLKGARLTSNGEVALSLGFAVATRLQREDEAGMPVETAELINVQLQNLLRRLS